MKGKTAMMSDFLKVNQEDDEDLKKLKQFSQKASQKMEALFSELRDEK